MKLTAVQRRILERAELGMMTKRRRPSEAPVRAELIRMGLLQRGNRITDAGRAALGKRPKFYECGICCQYHSAAWDGDCRQDDARFNPEDLDAKYGENGWDEVPMPGSEEGA